MDPYWVHVVILRLGCAPESLRELFLKHRFLLNPNFQKWGQGHLYCIQVLQMALYCQSGSSWGPEFWSCKIKSKLSTQNHSHIHSDSSPVYTAYHSHSCHQFLKFSGFFQASVSLRVILSRVASHLLLLSGKHSPSLLWNVPWSLSRVSHESSNASNALLMLYFEFYWSVSLTALWLQGVGLQITHLFNLSVPLCSWFITGT